MERKTSFEVVKVVLVQCNIVDSQCQSKSEVLYTFSPSKSYAYLLNAEQFSVLRKNYKTDFDDIIITIVIQSQETGRQTRTQSGSGVIGG